MRRNIEKRNHSNVQDKEDKENVGFINLPYIAGTNEILRRIFQKHKFRCTFYSCDTLRKTLSNPRDKIEKGKQNNIVYKIPCGDCNAVCICESKRYFDVSAVKNGDVDKNEADHNWKIDHKFDWENKIIIDREQNWRVRKIKETIHSISDKNLARTEESLFQSKAL